MKLNLFTTWILLAVSLAAPALYADPYTSQQDPRMQWYMDAKLGLMIHWGVYAVAEGRWSEDGTFDSWKKGDTKPFQGYAEQIMRLAAIPREEYRKLPEEFDWSKWNAQDIIDLCFATGQRYIVITSKHHDGFAMYHSKAGKTNDD